MGKGSEIKMEVDYLFGEDFPSNDVKIFKVLNLQKNAKQLLLVSIIQIN